MNGSRRVAPAVCALLLLAGARARNPVSGRAQVTGAERLRAVASGGVGLESRGVGWSWKTTNERWRANAAGSDIRAFRQLARLSTCKSGQANPIRSEPTSMERGRTSRSSPSSRSASSSVSSTIRATKLASISGRSMGSAGTGIYRTSSQGCGRKASGGCMVPLLAQTLSRAVRSAAGACDAPWTSLPEGRGHPVQPRGGPRTRRQQDAARLRARRSLQRLQRGAADSV